MPPIWCESRWSLIGLNDLQHIWHPPPTEYTFHSLMNMKSQEREYVQTTDIYLVPLFNSISIQFNLLTNKNVQKFKKLVCTGKQEITYIQRQIW